MVAVADDLNRSAVGSFPKPNSVIQPGACQYTSIGMPRHAIHAPLMSTQHASQPPTRRFPHLPEAHHSLRADTSQLCAIGTPGQIIKECRMPLQHVYTLRLFDVPKPQGAILAAAQQLAAVGSECQATHISAMSMQYCPACATLCVPKPDRSVRTGTCQRFSIRTPGHPMYERSASLFCLPRQRMQAASAAQLPQLEATIMASARQHTAVRSKGQVPHPAALSRERLDTVSHRSRLSLPESNRTSGVATGKPLSIGTPRQREDRVRMRQFLKKGT